MRPLWKPGPPALGTYLALTITMLSVLLTALLVGVSQVTAISQVRLNIGSNLAELASQTTSRLDRSMYERFREVQLMSRRLGAGLAQARAQEELEAMQASYPLYAWLGITSAQGRVVLGTGGLLTGADVSQRPWFRNAIQGQSMGDVHEAALLDRLLVRTGGEPMRFVDLAFPLVDEAGRSLGVLGAHLSWQWAVDVRNAIFLPAIADRGIEPVIVSEGGVVLMGPPDLEGQTLRVPSLARAALESAGSITETWPDGRSYLVGFSRDRGHMSYPGLGWRVLVRQELSDAEAPVWELQRRLLAGGLLAALLFSLLGWLAARLITRPLEELTSAALDIGRGVQARVPAFSPYREVAALGTALHSLVDNLQRNEQQLRDLNQSLEERVAERTAELRDAFAQVRQNEQRIQTIIESAPDPFVGMDFGGSITDWNTRAEQLFGWRRDEVLGRPLTTVLFPKRFAAAGDKALRLFLNTRSAPFVGQPLERILVDRQGREIPVELRVGLIDTGQVRLFSAFVHDISERKQVERLKDEFVSTVSHELRTPVTAIYGSLRLLHAGVAGELPAAARELVGLSNKSCERLIRLLNDVLDLEKMGSGQLRYEMKRQPLRPLLEQAVRDTQPFADDFGVSLRFAGSQDAQVLADSGRIGQVVVNLLSNAAKFSPAGAVVDMVLEVEGPRVRVGVVDQGIGIPESFRAQIFGRFAQADGSDRRQKGGTGLGLNICRGIIDAHEGKIGFASEPGVRTEFFFELPLA